MDFTDARGDKMTEWVAATDLVIINQGDKPTFVHRSYGSILDLTISTEKIRPFITSWNVLDEESFSDHKYILFQVVGRSQYYKSKHTQGWQTKKLNREKLHSILNELEENETVYAPENFSKNLVQICDKVMPRTRKGICKKPVYWWNHEIASLRKECLKKRREYRRNCRTISLSAREILWESYKASKKCIRNRIKKAKQDCWITLRDSIDRDIWSDCYKIAMIGILGFPSQITFTMVNARICLLDVEGKFYEHLLLERINGELEQTGGLSANQYGFRKQRQTTDAVNEVILCAKEAMAQGLLCVAITLDIRNAFNNASWQLILNKLRDRGISESLISIIFSYLSEREVILESEGSVKYIKISSGVPQGSVLGPTL
ncbi:uncharacterized protein [Leptinotarsa decemlineata]|uniref:uncharacterized protein n=1 Tax=Leptinotarsa decemlineata TaxID=7539 RepID=UPI003D3085C5